LRLSGDFAAGIHLGGFLHLYDSSSSPHVPHKPECFNGVRPALLSSFGQDVCRAPAIVFSGDGDPQTRQRAAQLGFSEYLLKPVQSDALRAAIRRATHAAARSGTTTV
jgi:hypothetical protein